MLNLIKNKKIRNWGIVIVIVAVLLVAGQTFFSAKASVPATNAEGKVTTLEVAETVETSGSLEAQPFAALNWKTSGVVAEVNVTPGSFVQAGDILLTLQPSSTSANIVSAQADLVTAQKGLEDLLKSNTDLSQAVIDLKDANESFDDAVNYLKYLQNDKKIPLTDTKAYLIQTPRGYQYQYKTISYKGPATQDMLIEAQNDLALKQSKYEDAQRTYERLKDGPNAQDVLAAQANVDAAQATVNSLYIIAPFDGQVLSVDSRVGDTVTAGELSVNLADMGQLYVEAQVDESDIANIQLGNQAEVTLDAVPGVTLTGKVTAINPVGENVSGLVKYKVSVNLDTVSTELFMPLGTTANVVITVKSASASLAVPITAIQNDSQGEFVWIIQSDGSTKRVDVVSGSIVGDQVVVTGDLQAGDRIQLVQTSSVESPNALGPLSGGN